MLQNANSYSLATELQCNVSFQCVLLFAVNSLKEFGQLLSSIENERDKIVSGVILVTFLV